MHTSIVYVIMQGKQIYCRVNNTSQEINCMTIRYASSFNSCCIQVCYATFYASCEYIYNIVTMSNITCIHKLNIIYTLLCQDIRTHLHFVVVIPKLEPNLLVFHSRIRTALLRLCAMFHLIVGKYVLAFPMNFVLVGDQVHSAVSPTSIFNGVFSWKLLYI